MCDACPICLIPMPATSPRLDPCGHRFHKQCFRRWVCVAGASTCPVCRACAILPRVRGTKYSIAPAPWAGAFARWLHVGWTIEIAPSGVTVRGPFSEPRHFPTKTIACVQRLGDRVVKLRHRDPEGGPVPPLVNTLFVSRRAAQVYRALKRAWDAAASAATFAATDV
jgi:hypothetical protein